jgi:hypothetical protein
MQTGSEFAVHAIESQLRVSDVNKDPNHNRVSDNGGPGGTILAATTQERARLAQSHIAPTSLQRRSVVQAARTSAPPSVTQREIVRSRPNSIASAQATVAHPRMSVPMQPTR